MKRLFSILAGGLFLSATFTAWAAGDRTPSSTNPPIVTWQAPASYTAPHSGHTALTDAAPPMPFIPLVPCRQYDSRSTTALADNTPRTVTLSGAPCGIPTTAKAVAVNITVFNIIGAGSNGVFKVDTVSPPTVSWINYPFTEAQRANAGVVGLTGAAAIVVQVNQGAGSVDFIVDVFGYYGPTPASTGNTFTIINPTNTTAILGQSLGGGIGIYGYSLGAGGRGVFGYNDSSTGQGVNGFSGPGLGVYGLSTSNIGVKGLSTSYNGVWAESTNWDALFASGGRDGAYIQGVRYGVIGNSLTAGTGYAGVSGSSAGGTRSAGVLGTNTTAISGAGVKGIIGSFTAVDSYWAYAGVRGFSANIGVLGAGTGTGVLGAHHDAAGAFQTGSYVGFTSTVGLHTIGNTSATGTKSFVEPHPTDAAKVIRYVALEGNEAGTYFRGKAVVRGGVAEIVVPESFRFVSDEEGLTVHVTPVGRAQAWIESADLNRIVIGSNRDVTINYIVHGVRKAYKDFEAIADNVEYVPTSATMPMPTSYPEETRKRLVANGTYDPDGTVNMNTAERMGWAQKWHDEEASAKAAQEAAATKAKAN